MESLSTGNNAMFPDERKMQPEFIDVFCDNLDRELGSLDYDQE
jgi:hypothetical protein